MFKEVGLQAQERRSVLFGRIPHGRDQDAVKDRIAAEERTAWHIRRCHAVVALDEQLRGRHAGAIGDGNAYRQPPAAPLEFAPAPALEEGPLGMLEE